VYVLLPQFRVITVGTNMTRGQALQPAIAAWNADSYAHSNSGWNQGIMNAAMLGLTDKAASMATSRAKTAPAKGYRFPAFAPHEQDFEPSADHFANMNAGLQLMLLQVRHAWEVAFILSVDCLANIAALYPAVQVGDGDALFKDGKMVLFPAWPCSWDVSFKLNGPMKTTIEGTLAKGKLTQLTVTPAARKLAVLVANCATQAETQALLA
jgi:hypothetical protein